MIAENGGSAAEAGRASVIADLAGVQDAELRMMLTEWKRWRARVMTAPSMRMRQERFDEATAFIHAIEEEISLRDPGERLRRQRRAAAKVAEIAASSCVPLVDFRNARSSLEHIKRRRSR